MNKRIFLIVSMFIFVIALSGCSLFKTYMAAKYGVGVSQDRWVGVYQLPIENQVGIIVADFSKFADYMESEFTFNNETLGFNGTGKLTGQVQGNKITMSGNIHDDMQGVTVIAMEGDLKDDVIEGVFAQRIGETILSGRFTLVRLTHTTYLLGVPNNQVTEVGQTMIDIGATSPGLLGPGRPDSYGPGIHSDATGRPFSWRTDDGQMSFGTVKENAYGLGVGMDQFGRPVRAQPMW